MIKLLLQFKDPGRMNYFFHKWIVRFIELPTFFLENRFQITEFIINIYG